MVSRRNCNAPVQNASIVPKTFILLNIVGTAPSNTPGSQGSRCASCSIGYRHISAHESSSPTKNLSSGLVRYYMPRGLPGLDPASVIGGRRRSGPGKDSSRKESLERFSYREGLAVGVGGLEGGHGGIGV